MPYLIDTNIWVEYLKRMPRSAAVRRRLRAVPKSQVFLWSVVKAELLYGAEKSDQRLRNLEHLSRLFGAYESLPFDDNAAEQYGRITAELDRTGRPIANVDLMIAAIALANGMTLVTRDGDIIDRVPGLSTEDWRAM